MPACVFGDDECAGEADVDDGAEVLGGHVGDQPDIAEPCAVDRDVEWADGVEQSLDRIFVGDIDRRRTVPCAQFVGPRAGAVAVEVGDGDAATFDGQRLGGRPSDAGCSADDDRLPGDPLATVVHPVDLSITAGTCSNLTLGG